MLDRKHPNRLTEDAYREANHIVFVTVCAKSRLPVLTIDQRADAVVECLHSTFAANLVAYCIMPDHVHAVVATDGQNELPRLVGQFKGRASLNLRKQGVSGQVWEKSFWDRHARKSDDVTKMIEYLLDNPVRKELCVTRDDWPYSQFCGFPW